MSVLPSATLVAALLVGAVPVAADPPGPPAPTPPLAGAVPRLAPPAASAQELERARALRVSLLTIGQGDAVWELFGHNAIRIQDPVSGTDVSYNWGLFDFADVDFVPRFLRGTMRYWMAGIDTPAMLQSYAASERSITAQELALTPRQKLDLVEFLEWNALPENRFYRYDYFVDNCSTRLRDALDRVLGGRLEAALSSRPGGDSYRFHTRRLTQRALEWYAGIDLLLGLPGDQPISAWEAAFVPMVLRDELRGILVEDGSGRRVSLVAGEEVLYTSRRPEPPAEPTSQVPLFLTGGLALGGALALLGLLAAGSPAGPRVPGAATLLAVMGGVWSLLAGVVGVLLVLVLLTDHVWMFWNENILQFSPFSLGLVALLPALARRGRRVAGARWFALGVAGLSFAGLVWSLLAGADQTNGEFVALAAPVHLGLAVAVVLLARAEARRPPTI